MARPFKTHCHRGHLKTLVQRPSGARLHCEECARIYQNKRIYNVTPERYALMLAEQKGCCAICGNSTKLAIDHNHQTGTVRALLCRACNSKLAGVEDTNFKQAAEFYLVTHA
jgi:hypothetical protein